MSLPRSTTISPRKSSLRVEINNLSHSHIFDVLQRRYWTHVGEPLDIYLTSISVCFTKLRCYPVSSLAMHSHDRCTNSSIQSRPTADPNCCIGSVYFNCSTVARILPNDFLGARPPSDGTCRLYNYYVSRNYACKCNYQCILPVTYACLRQYDKIMLFSFQHFLHFSSA